MLDGFSWWVQLAGLLLLVPVGLVVLFLLGVVRYVFYSRQPRYHVECTVHCACGRGQQHPPRWARPPTSKKPPPPPPGQGHR